MGKPKKGGYPPPWPTTRYVEILGGKIKDQTIAWGDSVVWQNQDQATYTLVILMVNGKTVSLVYPANVWATLAAVGADTANSPPREFSWNEGEVPPKDPYIYQYGIRELPNVKAMLTVQISVGPSSAVPGSNSV
jgi:hypothetical protein